MKKKANKAASGYLGQFLTVLRGCRFPWFWAAAAFLVNIGVNALLLKLPVLTADLMSGMMTGEALWNNILFYVLFALAACCQTAVSAVAQAMATRRARDRLWKKMMHIRVDYYDQNDPGELMSAVTNDLSTAMPAIMRLLVAVIPDVWYVVLALEKVSEYNVMLSFVTLAFLPVKYIYMVVFGRKFYRLRLGIYQQIGGLTGFLAERISNLPLIKSFTREEAEKENGAEAAQGLYKAQMREHKLGAVDTAIRTLISLGENVTVVIAAVVLLQQKKITFPQWMAFFLFFQEITMRFDVLVGHWMSVKLIEGTVARTADLLKQPEEAIEDEQGNVPGGDITFDHVSFSYGDNQALRDVSFTVPQGTKAAIVGLCGSGKTTSFSLLERFYAPGDGQILLGGKPVNEMPLGEYRRRFAYVQQNPEVFSGTAREALTYGISREVSDEEIWQAARTVGFAEYLEHQPEGLDVPVSSGGGSMSGGQRQRLVLTREFLRGAEVLLLDEPTSSLDAESTALVQKAVLTLFPGKTVLLITHDMDLLHSMDQIVVLENSRLVGCGTYSQLLEDCPLFREMIETQQKQEVSA